MITTLPVLLVGPFAAVVGLYFARQERQHTSSRLKRPVR